MDTSHAGPRVSTFLGRLGYEESNRCNGKHHGALSLTTAIGAQAPSGKWLASLPNGSIMALDLTTTGNAVTGMASVLGRNRFGMVSYM